MKIVTVQRFRQIFYALSSLAALALAMGAGQRWH